MRRLLNRAWHLIRRSRVDADLAEEMEFHRAMKEDELRAGGMTATDAAWAARREMGNATLAREAARAVWVRPWLESIWQDARFALRNLRRQPGFAAAAIAVLTVAIGLNTSLFTVFAGMALRPWSGVKDAARVSTVFRVGRQQQLGGIGFSLTEYRYLAEHAKSFSGLVVWRPQSIHLGFEQPGESSSAYVVSGNYFDVLGVAMQRGRGLQLDDDRLDAPRAVAVVSYRLWQRRFGADPAIVGKSVRLDDVPFTVIGVASAEFVGPEAARASLWIPFAALPLVRPDDAMVRGLLRESASCCSDIAGRLAPGVSREQAGAELEVLSQQFHAASPGFEDGGIEVTGTEFIARPNSKARQLVPVLTAMFIAVTLVLLLACANVGNLVLARAAARVREIGVRLSLGASRRRIVRQLLTESLILAGVAATLGLIVAYRLPPVLLELGTGGQPPFSIAPDALVLFYAVTLACLTCVAFGLAPALQATRCDVSRVLKDGTMALGSRLSLRSVLLAVQVAVSVVLLVGAGLLIRGVQRAATSDLGFSIRDVAVVSFDLPTQAYDRPRAGAFFAELAQQLKSVRGLTFALADRAPLSNSRSVTSVQLPGQRNDQAQMVVMLGVSRGYFDVLRIPVVAGRGFEDSDPGARSALVNEAMARRYWPNENPVGRTFIAGTDFHGGALQVVGVVKDAHTAALDRVEPMFFLPSAGNPSSKLLVRWPGGGDAVSAIVARLDPRVRIRTTSLAANLDEGLASSRVGAALAAMLGGFALILATVGICGVFGYVVQQRTREIGIRMALGAQRREVVRLILAGNSGAVLAGLAGGLFGAMAGARLLQRERYGLSPFDPAAYAAVALILGAAGLAASYWPARRASRLDPVAALRHE